MMLHFKRQRGEEGGVSSLSILRTCLTIENFLMLLKQLLDLKRGVLSFSFEKQTNNTFPSSGLLSLPRDQGDHLGERLIIFDD